jgi:hypothetical protein
MARKIPCNFLLGRKIPCQARENLLLGCVGERLLSLENFSQNH